MISRYPTLRISCATSFSRVSVAFRGSSFFLSGAPNRHLTIELTVSDIDGLETKFVYAPFRGQWVVSLQHVDVFQKYVTEDGFRQKHLQSSRKASDG